MKFLVVLVLLAAAVCVIQAKQQKRDGSSPLFRLQKKKVQNAVAGAKRYMQKRTLEKKNPKDEKRFMYETPCVGMRCMCEDHDLIGAFLSTLGNVVANCRIADLYMEATRRAIKDAVYDEIFGFEGKRDHQELYYFYDEICYYMYDLGLYYETNHDLYANIPDEDCHDSITTCSDYKEFLVVFHCVEAYMSLIDVSVAEAFHSNEWKYTNVAFEALEFIKREQCDSMFYSYICLAMGITSDSRLYQCDTMMGLLDIGHANLVKLIKDHEKELIDDAIDEVLYEISTYSSGSESSVTEVDESGSEASWNEDGGSSDQSPTKKGKMELRQLETLLLKKIMQQKKKLDLK